MNFDALVRRKQDGGTLSAEEVGQIVSGITDLSLDDAQVTTFLRAVFDAGMDSEETTALTAAMIHSGDVLQWPPEWSHLVVDKHSTGGVGDKVSLALAPALAACGLKVPMISGRGLGHTGGTLDKLESIPGFSVNLSTDRIIQIVDEVGCVICGQTADLVPADKRMYALRDVTGTVASIPLVTGSIVSKKAAETLVALVLDIKVGRAAFMQTEAEATELARSMVEAGNGFGITTSAILSSMDAPLGRMIGNALEVRESIEVLTGTGHDDLVELVCCLGGMLLDSTGVSADQTEGRKMIQEALRNGTAHEKFIDMVTAQGGDLSCDLPRARHQSMLQSLSSGFVESIDALALAHLTLDLGAGRKELGAEIDHAVGIELRVDVGDSVDVGDHWCVIHSSQELNRDQIDTVAAALTLTKLPLESESRIIKHIH